MNKYGQLSKKNSMIGFGFLKPIIGY